jgi:2-hydroxychromene-2-carboxylate isomerase
VPINLHPKHFPTGYAPSSTIIVAARQTGADVYPLTRALMRGCWVDEVDIGDPATCAAIADAAGLDGAALNAAAEGAAVADEIAANTDAAMAAGAWSVPSIVVDGELFFGQDRLELIDWRLAGN